MPNPLQTLLRLRALTVDQARQGLADCLNREAAAQEALRDLECAIARETKVASDPGTGDGVVDDFAVWLRRVRIDQMTAEQALRTAETHTNEARAVLSAGRAALRAVEKLIDEQAALQDAAEKKTEQAALDEIGTRR